MGRAFLGQNQGGKGPFGQVETCTREESHELFEGLPVAQTVKKHLPTMRETWVRYLGWEDPLEKEMAAHSSIVAWKIPWTEEPGRLQSMGS